MAIDPQLNREEERPLGSLIVGLASDVTDLVHKEIALAKAELSEKLSTAMGGVELLVIGAVVGIAAVGVLFTAIVSGIAAAFVAAGMDRTAANALSSLIVFIVAGIVAWVLVSRGRSALSPDSLSLNRTTRSLERDANAVKEKL